MAYRLALPRRAALVPPLGMCCSGLLDVSSSLLQGIQRIMCIVLLSYSSQANWLLGFGFCSFVRCHLVSRKGCRVCRLECFSHSTAGDYAG
jgi:hypothetical protein